MSAPRGNHTIALEAAALRSKDTVRTRTSVGALSKQEWTRVEVLESSQHGDHGFESLPRHGRVVAPSCNMHYLQLVFDLRP
jgi:hypothetical protein